MIISEYSLASDVINAFMFIWYTEIEFEIADELGSNTKQF